jgi:hypothetical protein
MLKKYVPELIISLLGWIPFENIRNTFYYQESKSEFELREINEACSVCNPLLAAGLHLSVHLCACGK